MSIAARQAHDIARWGARAVCIALVAVVGLAACGGSSKPAYCSARSELQKSINGLSSLSMSSSVSDLEAELKKIQTQATTLVSKAKSDFPSETAAIQSSVKTLTNDVNALKKDASATHISAVISSASGVVSSVKTFMDSTSSKCH
jgi:hypothetical protein